MARATAPTAYLSRHRAGGVCYLSLATYTDADVDDILVKVEVLEDEALILRAEDFIQEIADERGLVVRGRRTNHA